MKRLVILGIILTILVLFIPVMVARAPYSQRAAVYAFFYQTVGIGRERFSDRIWVTDPTLYLLPVVDQGPSPQVGKDTLLGVLSVHFQNQAREPVTIRVMKEVRLVDEHGKVYAPQWVSYTADTNKLLASIHTREIDLNLYNPGVSQYRYIVFLLPAEHHDYQVVSTDYSYQQPVTVAPLPAKATPTPAAN